MKKRMESVLSSLLCCCLFFSALSLNASALDGTEGEIDTSDFYYNAVVEEYEVHTDVTNQLNIQHNAASNYYRYFFPVNSPDVDRTYVVLTFFDNFNLNADHEYHISFNWLCNVKLLNYCVVYLKFYNSNNEEIKSQMLALQTGVADDYWSNANSLDFNFKADLTDISGGYTCKLVLEFQQVGYDSTTAQQSFYISDKIIFEDLDDDSGWFQKILNAIKAIPENIKSFFSNLGDRISSFFDELGAKIVDGFDNLKLKFEEFKQSVAELGENILDGLKSLFIPADGYFDNYSEEFKSWANEHLGFIYTGFDFISSSVDMLLNMCLESNGEFILPEAEFTLNGTRYVLWEEYVLDMDDVFEVYPALETAYNTYLIIVGSAFAFAILNYGNTVYCKFVQWGHD